MTTFTVSAGGTVNYDTLSGGVGNDTYNITNSTKLLIDTDTRYCNNHTATTGNLGAINVGQGSVYIDGTNVRIIPFSGGSGNVPATMSAITQGAITSQLLGVYSALNVPPTVVGGAMPASGWIKVKNKTAGAFYSAGALSGITANATGTDVAGWIEVIGIEGSLTSFASGTQSNFTLQGAWFDLGTTSGVANQLVQMPGSLANSYYSGVQIETAVSSGIFEWWPTVGDTAIASTYATDERAKVVYIGSQGQLTIGGDGTNVGGMLPGAGRKIRCPNVSLHCAAAGTMTANTVPNASQTTRYYIYHGAPNLTIDTCNYAWGAQFYNLAKVVVNNSNFADQFTLQTTIVSAALSQLCVGVIKTASFQYNAFYVNASTCPITINDTVCTFLPQSNGAAYYILAALNITGNRMKAQALKPRTSAAPAGMIFQSSGNVILNNPILIGSGINVNGGVNNVAIYNTVYSDTIIGTVLSTTTTSAIFVSCTNLIIDGFTFLVTAANTCQPKNYLIGISQVDTFVVRNIGSPTGKLNLGSINSSLSPVQLGMQGGVPVNGKVQRVYTTGNANPISMGSVNNIQIDNVWNDSSVAQGNLGSNVVLRGAYSSAANSTSIGSSFMDSFSSSTTGAISVFASVNSSTITNYVVNSGNESDIFSGSSPLFFTKIGQQVTWTTPYFILGHSSIAALPAIIGANSNYAAANNKIELDVDTGSGFQGNWIIAGSSAITIPSPLTVGFRLRIRFTVLIANQYAYLSYFSIPTITDAVTQQAQYPLYQNNLTLTGLQPGSDVVILYPGTSGAANEIKSTTVTGSTFTLAYDYTTLPAVDVNVYLPGYKPYTPIRNLSLTSSGVTIPVAQIQDRNYQ